MFDSRSRRILLGNLPFVHSLSAYKRILLTSILALITSLISLMFLILDFRDGTPQGISILAICMAASVSAWILNRKGKHLAAKLLVNLSVNATVFLFSESEPLGIGLYMFFIVTAIGSIAGFGLEELPYAIFGLVFAMGLFVLSIYGDFSLMPKVEGTDQYVIMNLTINFIFAFIASAVIVYFLVRLDYKSEYTLEASQKQLTQQNEELVKLNRELDRFVYSTSHDLRSPISSILGLIQLTKTTSKQEEINLYLELMEGRLIGLNKFIKDISDYSRNARTEVTHGKVYVISVVENILDNLLYFPGAEKIEKIVDVDAGIVLQTDATRLQVILSNLIANAFKYSDFEKPNPLVRISARVNETKVILIVEDNGVGIDEAYLPMVFDMFFRAHQNSEGSGLGLYIAREAVAKLNGTISATSHWGVGSKFTVSLPLN